MFDANIELDFSQSPAAGSVKMMCSSECGGEATAPVEASKAA